MVISTKFNIGDKVYAFYEEDGEIRIFVDKISEIVISKEAQTYYLEDHDCDGWLEEELVKTNLTTDLIKKIEELTNGGK